MIFVTVGTHSQGFNRLIYEMDKIANNIDEEIIMQIGTSSYVPQNTKYYNFFSYSDIINFMKKSRLIVCHGGAGTIIDAINLNKKIIVVPRLKKFNEVIDDHEKELANALLAEYAIEIVDDLSDLYQIILSQNCEFNRPVSSSNLVTYLTKYLLYLDENLQ